MGCRGLSTDHRQSFTLESAAEPQTLTLAVTRPCVYLAACKPSYPTALSSPLDSGRLELTHRSEPVAAWNDDRREELTLNVKNAAVTSKT